MKIRKKDYPILDKLEKGSLGIMPILIEDAAFYNDRESVLHISDKWKDGLPYFRKQIIVFSRPFAEAASLAHKSLVPLLQEILQDAKEDFIVEGTFVRGDRVEFLRLLSTKNSKKLSILYFIFDRTGYPLAFFDNTFNFIDSRKDERSFWLSEILKKPGQTLRDHEVYIETQFMGLCLLSMFKTYASVETKTVEPNTRTKEIGCIYRNDTAFPVTFLDSKWFTNLVRSEGFLVRGHFRLQPKKVEGVWTKELIWIDSFAKTGYTAPARKTQLPYEI